jgi:hypothetical protein
VTKERTSTAHRGVSSRRPSGRRCCSTRDDWGCCSDDADRAVAAVASLVHGGNHVWPRRPTGAAGCLRRGDRVKGFAARRRQHQKVCCADFVRAAALVEEHVAPALVRRSAKHAHLANHGPLPDAHHAAHSQAPASHVKSDSTSASEQRPHAAARSQRRSSHPNSHTKQMRNGSSARAPRQLRRARHRTAPHYMMRFDTAQWRAAAATRHARTAPRPAPLQPCHSGRGKRTRCAELSVAAVRSTRTRAPTWYCGMLDVLNSIFFRGPRSVGGCDARRFFDYPWRDGVTTGTHHNTQSVTRQPPSAAPASTLRSYLITA